MYKLYNILKYNFAYLSVAIIGAIVLTVTLNAMHYNSMIIIFTTVILIAYGIVLIQHFRLNNYLQRQTLYDLYSNQDIEAYEVSGYNVTIDTKFNITYFSKQFIDEYDLKDQKILGKNIFDVLNIDSALILKDLSKNNKFKGIVESYEMNEDGILRHHNIFFEQRKDIKKHEYYGVIHDVTSSIKSEQELKAKFLIDKFTGLPTKSKLLSDIDDIIAQPTYNTNTLIYISIDTFDEINEFFGLDIGNKILSRVANWLSENQPTKNSMLYKLDLDNFAILNTENFDFDLLDEYLKRISIEIQKEIFTLRGTELNITFTIGATRCKVDMIKCAYLALKEAKNLKKSYKIFDNGCQHEEQFSKNIQMVQMIKNAIAENRVVPFFQPIYNVETKTIEKYETLIRIKDKNETYLRPIEFLDVAKKSKLYLELSRSMIKSSFDQLEVLNFPITINLSVDDMLDPSVSSFIIRRLNSSGLAKLITFEIVESEKLRSTIKVINFVKKVRLMGAKVALDDFGSGYSNYEQLRDLEVDYLKIDGSLIKNIITDRNSEIFTKSIINVAKDLGIETIAEFVSSEEILEKVKKLGIDYVQGYHIGKPALNLLPSSISD